MLQYNSTTAAPQDESPANLAPHHYTMLTKESGIAPEVIAARGYWTATKKRELEDIGFAPVQRHVPALVLPIHGVGGLVINHQIRPDAPRRGRDGDLIKYETPRESRMVLDIPPVVRHLLENPTVPLFVTEGLKKGDAVACRSTDAAPFCVATLLGVWSWRGKNTHGGKAPLACWYSVALNDRVLYVVFDGDVMVKRQVWQALAALKPFLESRGATVRPVYLPQTLDGHKCGVDDYLVAGHTMIDLRALSTANLAPSPRPPDTPDMARPLPYAATSHGLVMYRQTADGELTVPLTNFTATIVTDIVADDGAEHIRTFEMEATLHQRTTRFTILAVSFASMTWVTEHLGASAIVTPGMTVKDHCRAAIQTLSTALTTRMVYTHCGWREMDGVWCYLHGAGAIGPHGVVAGVEVALGEGMIRYRFPEPPSGDTEREAIRASLRLLEVAPDAVILPLYMAVWRAVLGPADFAVYLVGPTGVGKSELAALMQQHFGASMDARHLPGAWTSTTNALGELQFLAKDVLLTIDDFAPTGSQTDQQRLHRDADRVLRNQGNNAGRQRMRSDGSLRPPKPPRCLLLATGEDLPRGQSLRSRLLILELDAATVDWSALSSCQQDATAGTYAAALAGFVRWLAPQYSQVQQQMPQELVRWRQQGPHEGHKRAAGISADLLLGWELFLHYAVTNGAITPSQVEDYQQRALAALAAAVAVQADYQQEEDAVSQFFALLHAALVSGKGHLAHRITTQAPATNADHAGWLRGAGNDSHGWTPRGPRLGWIDEDYLYLNPEATYAALNAIAREQGETIHVTKGVLWKRLNTQNVLERNPQARDYTIKVAVGTEGARPRVLKISLALYYSYITKSRASRAEDDNSCNDNDLHAPDFFPPELQKSGGQKKSGGTPKQEWQENQQDIQLRPTRPTRPTFLHIPPTLEEREEGTSSYNTEAVSPSDIPAGMADKHMQPSRTLSICPQCRSQRSQVTGASRMCLACGYTWQAELP